MRRLFLHSQMSNSKTKKITSPDDRELDELCDCLAENSPEAQFSWPGRQLRMCGDYGVYEWFLPRDVGGQAWTSEQIVAGYLKLSASCLTDYICYYSVHGSVQADSGEHNARFGKSLVTRARDG